MSIKGSKVAQGIFLLINPNELLKWTITYFYHHGSGEWHGYQDSLRLLDCALATTIVNIYVHINGGILSEYAMGIEQGLGNKVQGKSAKEVQNLLTDFQLIMRRNRKFGNGCIAELKEHFFEGRYSRTWLDGTKHSKFRYIHTLKKRDEKLKVFIQKLNTKLKIIQNWKYGLRHRRNVQRGNDRSGNIWNSPWRNEVQHYRQVHRDD